MQPPSLLSAVDTLVAPDLIITLLSQTRFWLIGLIAGLTFYAYLADRVFFEGLGQVQSRRLQKWDALLAALLIGFFLFLVVQAVRGGAADGSSDIAPSADRIVAGMVGVAVLFLLLITGILTTLRLRRISWRDTFGLTRLGPFDVVGRAALLLLLAYPLITVSAIVSQLLLAAGGDDDNSSQELVRFFEHGDSSGAKWLAVVSVVIIAPMQEEFLFRGYLYGVMRRYGGVAAGVFFNALLFALIHLHWPSFGPLFVLAVCLTLAYEWTGSLWVPMCMHSMFNSLTVINLLWPGHHPQP